MTSAARTVLAAWPLLLGCAEGDAGPPDPRPVDARVGPATERAAAWLRARPIESPHEFLFLGVLHRRFGVPEFAGMLEGYDRAIANLRTPDLLAARRILARDQTAEEVRLELLGNAINRIHAPALFCDQREAPRGYKRLLRESAALGGYELTHVALALIWMEALGCELPFRAPEAFRESVVRSVADLLVPDDGIDDLEIVACAFLFTLGAGDRVGDAFVDAFLEAQRPDGSWAYDSVETGDEADWHATCLALWLLYELSVPEPEKRPVLER